MPLPEKMSVFELEQEIKAHPEKEYLKDMLKRKLIRSNTNDFQQLKKDYLHYT